MEDINAVEVKKLANHRPLVALVPVDDRLASFQTLWIPAARGCSRSRLGVSSSFISPTPAIDVSEDEAYRVARLPRA
jgi:hypothetical protein